MSGVDPVSGVSDASGTPPSQAAAPHTGDDAALAAAASSALLPDAPPPAPRDVTPAASRRAWHEPRVHFWWIVALVLLAAAVWLGAQQTIEWNRDASLIRNGTRVDAVIWRVPLRVKGQPIEERVPVEYVFEWEGKEMTVPQERFTGRGLDTFTGQTIPLMVDPADPQRITARTEPPSLAKFLIGAAALVGFAVVAAAISIVQRGGVLAIWRGGEARPAVVVETSQTALAPRSRLVRCALTDGSDRRLISVYVPRRAATPRPGDGLWLIMPPGRPEKSVAAMLYG